MVPVLFMTLLVLYTLQLSYKIKIKRFMAFNHCDDKKT